MAGPRNPGQDCLILAGGAGTELPARVNAALSRPGTPGGGWPVSGPVKRRATYPACFRLYADAGGARPVLTPIGASS
jgi:hypothetical protein